MEPFKADGLKMPSMVMCGDHPSFTKTELNLKELKLVESKEKEKKAMSYARISPTSSRTEREKPLDGSRPASEHALRPARPAPAPGPARDAQLGNKELLQVAVGSFRWPPYLVVSWLLVLAAAHALHALSAALAAALPPTRKLCQYLRALTEASWRGEGEGEGARVRPAALAALTALLYALLGALAAAHALLRWAVEPLGADADERLVASVTDYDDFDVSVKSDGK